MTKKMNCVCIIISIYCKLPSSAFIIFVTCSFSVCIKEILMSSQLSIYLFNILVLLSFCFYRAHETKSKLQFTP